MQYTHTLVFQQIREIGKRSILIGFDKTQLCLGPGPKYCFNLVLFLCLFQAKTGFILNFVGVITINIAINTWGVAMFQLNTFPSWANVTKNP